MVPIYSILSLYICRSVIIVSSSAFKFQLVSLSQGCVSIMCYSCLPSGIDPCISSSYNLTDNTISTALKLCDTILLFELAYHTDSSVGRKKAIYGSSLHDF